MSYTTPQAPTALRRFGSGLIQLALILAIIANVLIVTPAVIAGVIFQMYEPIVFVIVASAVGWTVIWVVARIIRIRQREKEAYRVALAQKATKKAAEAARREREQQRHSFPPEFTW